MSSLSSVAVGSISASSPIAPWLEEIIDKKVSNIALSCFEGLVHWFLTTFSCFYPSYQNFYDTAAARAALAAQEALHPPSTSARNAPLEDKSVNQNVGMRACAKRSLDDLHLLNGRKARSSTWEPWLI